MDVVPRAALARCAASIASLRRFGVATKILTRDNALVTRKVGKDVSLDAGEIITGDQLPGSNVEELGTITERATVFARLSPFQKEGLIIAHDESSDRHPQTLNSRSPASLALETKWWQYTRRALARSWPLRHDSSGRSHPSTGTHVRFAIVRAGP